MSRRIIITTREPVITRGLTVEHKSRHERAGLAADVILVQAKLRRDDRNVRERKKLPVGYYIPAATACPCGCMSAGFTMRSKSIVDDESGLKRWGGRYYTSDSGCGTTLNLDCNHISVPERDDKTGKTRRGK